MPKKKAPAVAGSGGGAMSTTTAKSSSGRTSSREKSSSRRSPSKTSKNADPGESKQQQQHTRQAPPVFQIPPPPPPPNVDEVHAVKPTVNHRHNHRHEKSCNDENEAPLYENLAEIFGADAGCKTSVPHPRSRSVSALGNAGLEDDDDEDAESYLLQRCIQFGMPKSRSDLSDAKPFQRHRSEHSTRHSKKSASAERRKASDRVNGISSMMQQSTSSSQVDATASETLTHSQIIRRDARSMVTALIANRDSMVDSYASSTSTSDNLMESANPPPGLLMEDSVVVSSSMTESRLLGSSGSPGYRPNPGFGGSSRKNVLVSVKMTGSSSGGVAVGKMAGSRALEGSMSTSSAFFETAKPPFPEDMDHSMISIASITSEMAMSSAMKSSVTSENMFDLYRTAAAAMTAVYVDKAAPGTGNKSSTDDLDDSEMLADVQPPADLASSSIMGASLFKSASHESASSHDISGDKRAAAVAAEIGRCASGKKTSPKEKRQMDKERYQTYTLVVHGGNNKQDDGDIGETDSTAAARADEEEEVLRKQRKSRSGDKERYRTQTLERKQTPQRPRSSPEGSSETDTADRTPRKSESDPLETDLDADDQHQQQQRRRHHSSSSSTASKPRIVKPDENGNNSNTTTTTGEDPGASKAVRGRRRPLHAPKTGTFTRPKPSPELAALRSRIPDVSDSDSTVTSVDSSTFTRRPKSSASLESAGSSTAKPRSPLVVRETKTTKLRKQSSSPAAADLLRSSSNISVASSVSSHGSRRTPKVERKTQQPQVSVPPSKIAMLWRRADEARESQEVVAAKTTTTISKRAPPQTATTAAAGIGKRLAGASGGAGAPPPIPAKPKIKLTQKIGRFIKGSKETKPAATPAAKEFIYRPVVKKTEEKKRGEPPEEPEEKTEEVLLQQQQK
ncbi:unnamed protein product [Notodromas monacha]|uniref:Uncharacterized protein n=1 Tax=Notodromas monacha TaxID=399045 RepID=A0A7R9BQA5_9CRUS|nr:unnamed protein product [Notodromas monacha]CAG0918193.1 unnamed protein product [Notodromas monacha]